MLDIRPVAGLVVRLLGGGPSTIRLIETNRERNRPETMVAETQSEQPHWMTPLATTTPRFEQEFRYDIQTRPHNSGLVTDSFGVSKGFEIIPAKR